MMTKNNTIKSVTEFKRALHCLPFNMVNSVKTEIMEQMGWRRSTFISKLNGYRNLKKPEKIILKMIFEGYGIEFKN